tara:strand:- start:340 stop:576 length:237 start_codon:yes stop_codon:yes gene_type:complete
MFKDIKVEEILVYLMLIVVGYYIAKMFSRSCNGFSVGGQNTCSDFLEHYHPCQDGTSRIPGSENIPTRLIGLQRNCCQ